MGEAFNSLYAVRFFNAFMGNGIYGAKRVGEDIIAGMNTYELAYTAGYFSMESALAAEKATGGTHLFESRDGVTIVAKAISALVNGDDLVGYITYVID